MQQKRTSLKRSFSKLSSCQNIDGMHIFKCFERQELDLIVFNLIKNYFPDYFMMILYFIEIIQAGPKLFDSISCKKTAVVTKHFPLIF